MDKKKQINFNLNNFLLATSSMLDFVEKDIYKTTNHHSKRVAFLSLKIGEKFHLTHQEMFDLCAYSLVHNSSLNQTKSYTKEYYEVGESNISDFPFLCGFRDIIKYHGEYYNGSGVYGLKQDDIPLLSQIISFAHTIESKFQLETKDIKNREEVIKYVKENEEILFSKEIVEFFLEVSSYVNFWIDLENESDILYYIFNTVHNFPTVLTFEQLLDITSVFTKIVNTDLSFIDKCSKMTDYYEFEHKDKLTFLISASLQSIGKLSIPDSILNKTSELTNSEFEEVKSYPYYTSKTLNSIIDFQHINIWASRVQETLDGEGYPYKLTGKDLSLKDRLMCTLNIYQSLTQNKSYRDAFSHKDAISTMYNLSNDGKLDKAIINDIDGVLKS